MSDSKISVTSVESERKENMQFIQIMTESCITATLNSDDTHAHESQNFEFYKQIIHSSSYR